MMFFRDAASSIDFPERVFRKSISSVGVEWCSLAVLQLPLLSGENLKKFYSFRWLPMMFFSGAATSINFQERVFRNSKASVDFLWCSLEVRHIPFIFRRESIVSYSCRWLSMMSFRGPASSNYVQERTYKSTAASFLYIQKRVFRSSTSSVEFQRSSLEVLHLPLTFKR